MFIAFIVHVCWHEFFWGICLWPILLCDIRLLFDTPLCEVVWGQSEAYVNYKQTLPPIFAQSFEIPSAGAKFEDF